MKDADADADAVDAMDSAAFPGLCSPHPPERGVWKKGSLAKASADAAYVSKGKQKPHSPALFISAAFTASLHASLCNPRVFQGILCTPQSECPTEPRVQSLISILQLGIKVTV